LSVTTWNTTTIDGVQFLVVDVAKFRIPLEWDPSSNMFIAVCSPDGGYGNIPALLKGDKGDTPVFDSEIDLTVLDFDDPTADAASLTYLGSNIYQAALTIHKGPQGDDGAAVLDPDDYGTPVAEYILIVNPTADGFVYQAQKVGDRFVPASINSTAAGNPTFTLASVSIPAQPFDWRPEVSGQAIITGTGANVTVDLLARLDNATSGNIVGRACGIAGQAARNQVLTAGPPAGSADSYDRVAANASAVVYFRAERQSGTDTFTTSSATTTFKVRVCPVP
jgi:hypothetical protein